MKWLTRFLNHITGAEAEIIRLMKHESNMDAHVIELNNEIWDLKCQRKELDRQNAALEKRADLLSLAIDALGVSVAKNKLTKRHLDEQAAIQLEMDALRVGMENELTNAKEEIKGCHERLASLQRECERQCIELNIRAEVIKHLKLVAENIKAAHAVTLSENKKIKAILLHRRDFF